MDLSGSVDVPLIGATHKKTLLYVGAGVVLIAGVWWYRRQGGVTAGADSGDSSGPINPATGYPTGSPEDLAAMDALDAQGAGGYGSGATDPAPVGSLLGGTSATLAGPVFSDNHAWEQYAQDYLVNVSRLGAHEVSAALGAYLAGQPVSDRSIIDQATAVAGHPPIAGQGGYPPSIKVTPAPAIRNAANPVQNLRATNIGPHGFTVLWGASPRATSYSVRIGNRAAVEVQGTNHVFRQLKPDTAYTVRVKALPAAASATAAKITVHTKKG